MIAHYGYKDGEGEFYITIDQGRCAGCPERPCVAACPQALLLDEEDPYGERVVAVDDRKRKRLKYECMACKPSRDRAALRCVAACPRDAIRHSW